MFYSLSTLFGIRIRGTSDNNYMNKDDLDVNSKKMEEYFKKFRKDERPFGIPK